MSKAGREYKEKVSDYIAQSGTPKLGDARVHLEIVLWPKDKRKYDLDNRLKALLDSIENSGVINSDEQVDSINVYRGTGTVSGGQARVMIWVEGEQ